MSLSGSLGTLAREEERALRSSNSLGVVRWFAVIFGPLGGSNDFSWPKMW